MLTSDHQKITHLPTAEELPYTDNKPVDSELQDKIAHLLEAILARIWALRNDWFFGIDVGWYYQPHKNAIAPDGFLCLGVERIRETNLRLSYVSWQESGVTPILTLEVVSKTPGNEYKEKKRIYAEQAVLYYVIYAPRRVRKRRLTIYRLNQGGQYELIDENPVWMPEIGLGIGTDVGTYQGITREWLYWYDREGNRYLTPEEGEQQAQRQQRLERQARQQAEQQQWLERQARQQAEQRAQELAARLRELGIDIDELN